MIHLQSNKKQQVVTDGNPYLCEDCNLRCPIECLDVQVLLDPFGERLDSPSLSVQFCNGNISCAILYMRPLQSNKSWQISL